ncbi:hypothetical protein KKC52_12485 [bacterium]|nr:hypothetical protein [bacterium]
MKGDKVEMANIILPACAVGTADRFNPDNPVRCLPSKGVNLRPSASHKKITIAKESMNQ